MKKDINCIATLDHSPGANLDYWIDWDEWLVDGRSIASSTWSADEGVVLSEPYRVGNLTSVIAKVIGEVGKDYMIVNTVVIAGARAPLTDNRAIKLRCRVR